MKPHIFRTFHLSIIRSLFTLHSAMVYVIQVCRQFSSRSRMFLLGSCLQTVRYIPLLSVQWINSWCWTEEMSETCRVSFPYTIYEISASIWFYYKGIGRGTYIWKVILFLISKGILQYTIFRKNKEAGWVFLEFTLSRISIQNHTWARDYQRFIAELFYTQYYLHRGLQEEIGLPVEGMCG